MQLSQTDWIIIIGFFAVTLILGLWSSRRAGRSAKDYFLSGRDMPWWLLGVSMVATTFSADTPNLVTDIVRQHGVSGNWVWWAFLITGMATVFIYAKLWRRSGITTDLEFYELRYSGPVATFLRGFRAIYLGVLLNVIIMATVLLAGIKISGIMLGISPTQTVLLVSLITVVYSSSGGLRGILLTDFFQFFLSMAGMIAASIYILDMPEIGGLTSMMANPAIQEKINLIPDLTDKNVAIPLFFIPLAVQWWSTWYPGAEPGGGGYIAQRMLSAQDERSAVKATLLFNVAHYALRPWPWILIALASIIVFPDLADIKAQFTNIDDEILADDLAFPAMLTTLPSGLLGLVVASLIAALMSTISTHLNWGSSYLVHDFYLRFIDQDASSERQVLIGRLWTVALMILAGIVALFLEDALSAFNILLQLGAGTGLLFLLRWFWWRINAYSEISAMIISFVIAIFFQAYGSSMGLESYQQLVIGVTLTSIVWIAVTFLTRPTDHFTLSNFYQLIRPAVIGWTPIASQIDLPKSSAPSQLSQEILMMFLGCVMVYAALFCTGFALYGNVTLTGISFTVFLISTSTLVVLWRKVYQ